MINLGTARSRVSIAGNGSRLRAGLVCRKLALSQALEAPCDVTRNKGHGRLRVTMAKARAVVSQSTPPPVLERGVRVLQSYHISQRD